MPMLNDQYQDCSHLLLDQRNGEWGIQVIGGSKSSRWVQQFRSKLDAETFLYLDGCNVRTREHVRLDGLVPFPNEGETQEQFVQRASMRYVADGASQMDAENTCHAIWEKSRG